MYAGRRQVPVCQQSVDCSWFRSSPPLGYTTNIRSAATNPDGTPQNLTLDNGTPLNSFVTFVPVGYRGPRLQPPTAEPHSSPTPANITSTLPTRRRVPAASAAAAVQGVL